MIRFECDYAEGAHPSIIKRLTETNFEQTPGYGVDEYCETARKYIKKLCGREDAGVHFLVGGTQTNSTVISAVLRPHQGVICASTGHIAVHESGTVEASGHKVLTIPSDDGKITADQIKALYDAHWSNETHEHEVQPGMVYISFPTENGTLYSKAELTDIYSVCKECDLPLYIDGARLGYGLMSDACDMTIEDMASLCDAFYIGGTKQGFLFGEALVVLNSKINKDFRYILKQHGGMLSKGRLLGLQFCAMFEDDLYFALSKEADRLAMKLRKALLAKGYKLRYDSFTNQQFPILSKADIVRLKDKYAFSVWEKLDENYTAVRFCTSWATDERSIDELIKDL